MGHPDLLNYTLSDADDTRAKSLEKSPNALRTISEAADLLDVPQHVLRFWETKFSHIKPLKRNGGRRYYRPADIEVLQQIKFLLYRQGYTIKGAKKAIDELQIADNSGKHWIEAFPPANVNDNELKSQHTDEPSIRNESHSQPAESSNQHAMDSVVQQEKPNFTKTDALKSKSLSALRDELLSLRQALTPYM